MKKILGIGNALVDIMIRIDNDEILNRFDLPKGSMQMVDNIKSSEVKKGTEKFRSSLSSGGSAANTIHGLGMLGLETSFIGSVGKDDTGDFFEKDMRKAGVNTRLIRRETVTGTAIALVSPDSERTFATHLGAATELNPEDLRPEYFKGYDILYMEGYLIFNRPLVEKACQMAKSHNLKVVVDLASYNVVEAKIEDFREIVTRYVDILFANEEEARAYTGKGPEEALEDLAETCETVIIKTGSKGSVIKRGEEYIKVGTIKVKPKDTTGAGDLYASGFLYGYAMNYPLDVCGQIGSLLAGKVIETLGAKMSDKKWENIKTRIEKIIS